MKIALIFPGQAAQFTGMGATLVDRNKELTKVMHEANEILGFNIGEVMFEGSEEELKRTDITQPSVFIHAYLVFLDRKPMNYEAVAGHSLGEFTALVASGALSFAEGLELVKMRSQCMQKACEVTEGTMSAIIGLEDQIVEEVCSQIDGVVTPANYNCPGQLVISGAVEAVKKANVVLTEKGARRAILLNVGGAFHSALMRSAATELEMAVNKAKFKAPKCPIYQNVDGRPYTDPEMIQANLIAQLDSSVLWTQTIKNMINDGIEQIIEVGGRGNILAGMVRKIDRKINMEVWKE